MMPRRSRIDAAGALHHVLVRGTERGEVFRSDIDREHFGARLAEVQEDTKAIGCPLLSS
jgi:putative transposase